MLRAEVTGFLDDRFPPSLAEEWDRSGLQVGPLDAPCRRVLVALDFDLELLPKLPDTDLLVTHHPILFRPLSQLRPKTPLGKKLRALLVSDVACYSVHTPYDVAQGGMGEVLAGLLDLQNTRPLRPRGRLLKLVVFVPQGHVDQVAEAVFSAGAGKIGRYGHCSFRTEGTGTFLPEAGTKPFIGEVGKEEHVQEVRLETIVPHDRAQAVVAAMLAAHPYEEVAYDLYPLENKPALHGLGRMGELPEEAPAHQVIERFAAALGGVPHLRVYGAEATKVRRVAVCGGSGGTLWREALAAGAQLYLTGEIDYHDGLEAAEAGLTVAALGHRETERPFVRHVASLLRDRFPELEVIET